MPAIAVKLLKKLNLINLNAKLNFIKIIKLNFIKIIK